MALIRANKAAAGGSYSTFTPAGNSANVAGTNFTEGKSYIILYKLIAGTATLVGATLIDDVDLTNIYVSDGYHAILVTATASTISVGAAGNCTAKPMTVEMTL